ncbi:hypothetical protein D1227_15545 [Henriciella mobilis]|uniref:hypothetical protein n=1 Tax=Henriciella mobilis TaxID=2305467 RepID=UPI000E65F2CA|nr:hypothetical protein [Henriciella mobilis]RIJ14366.1 hypothetical protein D1231_16495 [Henriciella mobilis]RIJ19806.1 hypothetical protein D1227_15545 [Henriciella mobilis]
MTTETMRTEQASSWMDKALYCLLFLLIIAPVFFVLPLGADLVPISDRAANSILIDQAKSDVVWHGNYSRVGFVHPGPFFIYVMTFGEVVFHDLLKITSAPVAQNIGAAIYASVFFILSVRTLRSANREHMVAAIVAVCVSIACLHMTLDVVSTVWPPNLYVPAAFLLGVSAWAVLNGSGFALIGFCLAGGALVHGHASNLALVPLIAVLVALRLGFKFARKTPFTFELKRSHLVWCAVIFTAFVFPFAVHNLTVTPPEIMRYAEFSDRESNSLAEGLYYTAQYWKTGWALLIPVLAVIAAVVLALRQRAGQPDHAAATADAPETGTAGTGRRQGFSTLIDAFWVLAAFTLALAYYATAKIDNLHEYYIGYWYYGAIASGLAVLVFIVLRAIPVSHLLFRGALLLGAVSIYLGTFSTGDTNRIREVTHDPGIAPAMLEATAGPKAVLIPLELRFWQEGAMIVNLYDRSNAGDICLMRDEWHVLYGRRNICSAQDIETAFENGDVFFLARNDSGVTPTFDYLRNPLNLIASYQTTGVYKAGREDYVLSGRFTPERIEDTMLLDVLAIDGFSTVGSDGVWMDSEHAELLLPFDELDVGDKVVLDFAAFLPNDSYTRRLVGRIGGEDVFSHTFRFGQIYASVEIEVTPDRQLPRTSVLSLEADGTLSPGQFGSDDHRYLAVTLLSITKVPAGQ